MSGFIDLNADNLIDKNEFIRNAFRMGLNDQYELEIIFIKLDDKKQGLVDKNKAFIEISKLITLKRKQ
ncbi:unnamed protein product [Brachionus calyciflorus]|uniref:EF-hand domain-containing protein n=1 Tax=Brachionus calyciflorus TaxID=104777 RepID=A0A813V3Z2_9BILA|nr:unnamed protein product [Brachionus calyciflorus]